jgi:hypothetical protein
LGDVLGPRGKVFGAALRLADGRGLALDRRGHDGYIGWAVYGTADFDEGEAERLHDVTVADALDLAPEERELILTATLDAIAVLRLANGAGQPTSDLELRQSERLVDELVEAGQPRDTVVSLAGRLSRAHLVARDLRTRDRPAPLPPEHDARFESDEQLPAVHMRTPRWRRSALPPRLAAAAGALVLVAVVALLTFRFTEGSKSKRPSASTEPSSSVSAPSRTPTTQRTSPAQQTRPPTVPVSLSAIGAWDPYGDSREHDTKASAAEDGDSGTYWPTETYVDGLQKPGVGLLLDAGRAVRLRRLVVTTDTPGYSALIEAGSGSAGPFQPISRGRTVTVTTTFALGARAARYYLIWITRLDHTAHVNEVRAFGHRPAWLRR